MIVDIMQARTEVLFKGRRSNYLPEDWKAVP